MSTEGSRQTLLGRSKQNWLKYKQFTTYQFRWIIAYWQVEFQDRLSQNRDFVSFMFGN